MKMSEEQQSPEPNQPEMPKRSGPRRRGRRGGRGRHRSAPNSPDAPVAKSPAENEISTPAGSPPVEKPKEKISAPPREPEFNESAVSRAVEEVTRIVESLRQTLAQMEDVLELVELAERQKLADEREIDSLRRALRKIQAPREKSREPSPPREP